MYGRILDCGSGSGETWKQTGYRGDVTLCDVAYYETLYPFLWVDIHHLPFTDKAFDCVVLSEVLEHCLDPDTVLSEAKRVCSNRIVITVPDEYNWDPQVEPFMSWEDHVKGGELELIKKIPILVKDVSEFKFRHHWHLRQFTGGEIQALLERHDLKVKVFLHRVEDLKPYAHYFIVAEV